MSLDDRLSAAATLEPDSQFLAGTNVQYAWDSVSLTSILSCPQRYKLSIIEGWHPKATSYAIALVFGILFHKGPEFYHRARAAGADHEEALRHAVMSVAAMPETSTLPTDEDIDEKKEAFDPDEDDGIDLRNSKVRTRYYLFRAIVWYLEHYRDDPASTIIMPSGAPAVELSFRIPLDLGRDSSIILCGHIDRGVIFNDRLYASDYKTTKSLTSQFFSMFDLSHQMTGYTVAGKVIFDRPVKGVLIDGIALQVGAAKFARAPTNRTPGQIGEYFDLLRYATSQARMFYERDFYPLNTAACYFCLFQQVCSQPPEYREQYLKMHYERQRGWNPLISR